MACLMRLVTSWKTTATSTTSRRRQSSSLSLLLLLATLHEWSQEKLYILSSLYTPALSLFIPSASIWSPPPFCIWQLCRRESTIANEVESVSFDIRDIITDACQSYLFIESTSLKHNNREQNDGPNAFVVTLQINTAICFKLDARVLRVEGFLAGGGKIRTRENHASHLISADQTAVSNVGFWFMWRLEILHNPRLSCVLSCPFGIEYSSG